MSFSLVYCSFCKSSLRIASCQISSPKIHAGASNAPRTHFNITGSNRVRKCQRVSRSQSLLQHTWLALQLSEISVFTGAGKKRFLSFESTALVPEQTGFKMLLVLLSSSETEPWEWPARALVPPGQHRGHVWDSLASLRLLETPFFSWKSSPGKKSPGVRFQWEMTSRCWMCPTSAAQDRGVQRSLCLHSSPNHEVFLAAFPWSQHVPPRPQIHSQADQEPQENSRHRQKIHSALMQAPGDCISHLPFCDCLNTELSQPSSGHGTASLKKGGGVLG